MHETTSAASAAGLREPPLEKLREFSSLIEEDVFAALRLEDALAAPRAREELARAGSGTADKDQAGDGDQSDA